MAEALKKHMEQNVVLVDELNHSKPNDWLMPDLFANYFNIFPKDSKTYEPSMNTLKGIFGEHSKEAEILSKEKYNSSVKDIADYISENPDKRKSLISEKLLANEIPNIEALRGFEKLISRFGEDSKLYQFLDKHSRTHENVSKLADFIEGNPEPRIRILDNLTGI